MSITQKNFYWNITAWGLGLAAEPPDSDFFSFRDKTRRWSVGMIKWVWADLRSTNPSFSNIKSSFYSKIPRKIPGFTKCITKKQNWLAPTFNEFEFFLRHNLRRWAIFIYLLWGRQTLAEAAGVRVQPGVRVPLSQGVVCEQGRGHLGGL